MEVGRTKTCSKCGAEKGLECFARQKGRKFGVRSECKACNAAYNKEYHATNRERTLAQRKEYQRANHGQIVARERAYRRACKQTNPQYRLARVLRARLRMALRRKAKRGSAVRDLGMPIDAFLVYLNLDALDKYGIPYTGNENLFHIDHIRPLASFDLEDPEQLKIAVRWDNLQVLRASENLAKGARTTLA